MAPPSAGVDNTQRRKWDKEEYAAKAAERERAEEERERGASGRPRPPAGAIVERKALSVGAIIQRDYKKELEARVGTKSIVNLDTGEGLGFKCKETGVILRDSASYLDHINGKKQQRALGLSMRVERSTVDQVKARLETKKREREEETRDAAADFERRVAAAERAEEALKEQRAERKRAKKEEKRKKAEAEAGGKAGGEGGAGGEALEDDASGLGGMDPEMAAMMGFSGFGGGAKK